MPSFLDHMVRNFRHWLREVPTRARLLRTSNVLPAGRPAVITGQELAPLDPVIVRGGRVKLQQLSGEFPASLERFNILYLVSSALPLAAHRWIDLARRSGARFVWNQNGVGYPAWTSDVERTNAPLRELMARADRVVYQSEFCRTSSERWIAPSPRGSLVLPNPVDTAVFCPGRAPLPDEPLVLIAPGSHQNEYRTLGCLDVVRELKSRGRKVRLILAGFLDIPGGEGACRRWIHERDLTSEVEIVPPYPRDGAPDLFRRAHILIHTKYKDPCPTVVLEAMSTGLPVIGSSSGGMPELVGDEGGILLPVPESWDVDHLPGAPRMADAVLTVAADLPRWSRSARQRAVREFDVRRWLERHRQLFEEILSNSP